MTDYDCDTLVIGAGPAGESAAMDAAKHGLRTMVVDARQQVGGACTHLGTIPSKALRAAVRDLARFSSTPLLRDLSRDRPVSYPELLNWAGSVIGKQVRMRNNFYLRNRVPVLKGRAELIGPQRVRVHYPGRASEELRARHIILATGSRPYRPADVDFDHPRIYDSDTILDMRHTPSKLLIYGAGVIGCEYASIFAAIGIKVELINWRDRLLEFLDDEISDALTYHLRQHGVMVRHREAYQRVEADGGGITLHLESGKQLHGDALLWCQGRSGNTEGLGLENLGLSADHRGHLAVDEHCATEVESLYAAGDVIGWPSLASAAYHQGRAASEAIRGQARGPAVRDVATGIYTLPEISSVGRTERELTEARTPYEVGRALFKDTARGQISGEDVGMLKLLFHPATLELLGVHCFGAEATEIIHIGQAIMEQQGQGNSLRYFVDTTFNYPTMAEAYRIAALNGLNRLSHRSP